MEEALVDIVMKSISVVIHLVCDGMVSWVRSIGELCLTQIVDQWVYWLTNPPSEEELLNIKCLIAVFPGTNKNDGSIDPDINLRGHPSEGTEVSVEEEMKPRSVIGVFSLPLDRWDERFIYK